MSDVDDIEITEETEPTTQVTKAPTPLTIQYKIHPHIEVSVIQTTHLEYMFNLSIKCLCDEKGESFYIKQLDEYAQEFFEGVIHEFTMQHLLCPQINEMVKDIIKEIGAVIGEAKKREAARVRGEMN